MRPFIDKMMALNERFAEVAARISSWSLWLTLLIFGSTLWLTIGWLTHGRFDPGYGILVLMLTIQTSIDSAAQRQNQMALRVIDEKRELHQIQQMDAIAELTVAIKDELDHSKERDDAAAVRDEALLELISKLLDLVHTGEPK